MKTKFLFYKTLFIAFFTAVTFVACNNDDDTPAAFTPQTITPILINNLNYPLSGTEGIPASYVVVTNTTD